MRLTPMSEDDYDRFLARAVDDFAEEQIEAGAWQAEDAQELAKQMFTARLPEGLSSPNQYLYMIEREKDGSQVGELWWGIQEQAGNRFATLNEFIIFPEYRRRGYGRKVLEALENIIRQEGLETILLHVFGHNKAAWGLYRKMGYVERNVTMRKVL